MKNLVFILFFSILQWSVHGQVSRYDQAMAETLAELREADDAQDFMAIANKFERIAAVEKDKWHPSYYAAFAMAITATNKQDPAEIDETLDGAQTHLEHVTSLDHDRSEALALQGFIHMARIAADPAARGQQYSGMSAASLQKARSLNPKNPRAMYMLAQLSYGTAQFFGSDTSEACQLNEAAIAQFKAVKNEDNDPFAPAWGEDFAVSFQGRCEN